MIYLYPIFLECKLLTLDPYWQEVFEQSALGKFPKGIFYNYDSTTKKNTLVINTNKKDREIIILDENRIPEIFKNIVKICKEQLGMLSERDLKKQKGEVLELKEKIKQNYEGTWKQIKPKRIKDALFLEFINKCKKSFNLPDNETAKLYSYIKLGLLFRTITSDSIDYSDGNINWIEGLQIENSKVYLNFINEEEDISKLEKKNEVKLSLAFERYLREYKQQILIID